MPARLHPTLLLVLATAAAASANEPWVIPPEHANVEGTGAAVFIYNSGARTYMITLPGRDFANAPGLTLEGYTTRMRRTTAGSWPAVDAHFVNFDVYISELAIPLGELSTTFSENYIPGTEVQVRSGPMTVPANSFTSDGTLPNPFGSHIIDFDVPFEIDPSKNYLMTVRHTGHTANNQSMDRLLTGGDYSGRSGTTYTATTGGSANWIIPQFWVSGEACYANCDGSTVEPILNVDDFTCFINEFAAAQNLPHEQQVEHYANCDGSTVAPVLNVDDFTCFINEFAAGCP